jgi:hypothetical protein
MREFENPQKTLQGLLDCYLETSPKEVLQTWADDGWSGDAQVSADETCLKFIALVLLDSLASRAQKTILAMDGSVLVVAGDEQHMLPLAPESMLARGLELLCGMCGLEGGSGEAVLALEIRGSNVELRIAKSEAGLIISYPCL